MVSNCVLGSIESATYPLPGTSCLGSLGWVGENGYAYGSFSPAALLGERRVSARPGWVGEIKGHFEQPVRRDNSL
jgi:hypothetical protein